MSGTVFADGKPRLVDIKGIRVDAEFGKSMIYVTNEDKPGFIGRFACLLGDAKINIATFHLGRNKPGGDAIALVEVDGDGAGRRARQGAGAAAGEAGQAAAVLKQVFPGRPTSALETRWRLSPARDMAPLLLLGSNRPMKRN